MEKQVKVYNKPNLKKTQSSFSVDKKERRDEQIRRDNDLVSDKSINIQDVDEAIIIYLRDILKPSVVKNNVKIDVPVVWINSEKNKDFTDYGYMRDDKGKVQCPLIGIRKSNISKNDSIYRTNQSDLEYVFTSKYSKENRYYDFKRTTNEIPKKEVFAVKFPSFIDVTYQLILQTDLEKEADEIVKSIIELEGNAFGDTNKYKFTTYIDSYDYDVTNDVNSERFVIVDMNLKTFAYLVDGNVSKFITPSKIIANIKQD